MRVWTRPCEVTAGLPGVARVRRLPGETLALDGETLALDDGGRPRTFQETVSRHGSDVPADAAGAPEVLLTPFFLDVPLQVRLDAAQVVRDAPSADGHEGVVVRDLDATYATGRRGAALL